MKQFFSIIPLSIAVLLITVFSIVPHHHHKEVLCVVMEICEQDNAYNDQHTNHETSQEEASHSNDCVVDALYTAPSSVLGEGSGVDSDNQDSYVKLFCLLVTSILDISQFSTVSTTYARYVVSYQPAPLGLSSGLRAPPVCLS